MTDLAADDRPRFAEERRQRIVGHLKARGRVEVLELAGLLGVSEHTIRRDLHQLQLAGALQKTHGGAVALDTSRWGFAARASVLPDAKEAIGRSAAGLIQPGQTLILDAGSTTLALARALAVRPLTVITNGLDVARCFDGEPQVQLVLTGGTWSVEARALRGPAALSLLAGCRADWAVLGACALHERAGITVTDEADAALKRAMLAAAARTLLLADHSKRDSVGPFAVASWAQVHALVTDQPWPQLEEIGVAVRVAS